MLLTLKILAFSGSLRKESHNKKDVQVVHALLTQHLAKVAETLKNLGRDHD